MNSDRLATALEEARRVEKQLIVADREKEDQRQESLTLHLSGTSTSVPIGA